MADGAHWQPTILLEGVPVTAPIRGVYCPRSKVRLVACLCLSVCLSVVTRDGLA